MRFPRELAQKLIVDVEVLYGEPSGVSRVTLSVEQGTTVAEAVRCLRQRTDCAHWQIERAAIGVFGRIKSLDYELAKGDRLEVYLPLGLDPKEARRLRAKNQRR
jgi:putative ubiquitin-RnfH superfamily antitoxin RatB of RatAB toxin-antitoxin module